MVRQASEIAVASTMPEFNPLYPRQNRGATMENEERGHICPLFLYLSAEKLWSSGLSISPLPSGKTVLMGPEIRFVMGAGPANVFGARACHGNMRLAYLAVLSMNGDDHRMQMHADKRTANVNASAGFSF